MPDTFQRAFAPTPSGFTLLLSIPINRGWGRTPCSHLVERSERRMCPRAVQHRLLRCRSRSSPLIRQRSSGAWSPGSHLILASFLIPAPPRQDRVAAGSCRSRRMLTLLSSCRCWCRPRWYRCREHHRGHYSQPDACPDQLWCHYVLTAPTAGAGGCVLHVYAPPVAPWLPWAPGAPWG